MTVTVVRNTMSSSLGRIRQRFGTLPKLAFDHWRKITPKLSGNAKRQTRLKGSTIEARYPYAKRLDEGWSKQAPRGMSAPTFEFIKRKSKRMLRK